MVINIVLMLLILPEDYMDLNNWIELGLWTISIAALLSMKKWGIAFVIFLSATHLAQVLELSSTTKYG